jgi:peptidyl-prolyl cis-trans isomerase SurA
MRLKSLMMTTVVFALFAGIIGCGGTYVADIAGDKISVEEFEQIYSKNNGGPEAAAKTSPEDRQKFLDLYVKFRLKVKEAYALGYGNDKELRSELNEYRKNLAVSYMLEKEITKPALEKMYQRKLKSVRASHILVGVPSVNPEDTLLNFNEAMKIIDSLKMGYDFETLAMNNSRDPSAQQNKGDLYYFSTGQLVPEFEDAAYNLKPGEISTVPIRTQFGYHIIKVVDVKDNVGAVQASHIMKRLTRGSSAEDSARAFTEINAVIDSIKAGKSFSELAKTTSDDNYSAERGGDLGFIERGRTVREFDEALFNMKDGEVSGIIKTQFGLHIIKRDKAQGIAPFKEMEQQLKTEYQNYRFQYDYNTMVNKIRSLYSFKQSDATAKAFAAAADTSKTTNDAKWDSTVSASVRAMTIFTFAGKNVSVDEMIELAKNNQELKNLALNAPNTVNLMLDKVGIGLVTEHHAQQLQDKFPDFNRTMKEYEEGILLFKAEQENVWNKVVPSDSALRTFHAERKDSYRWPDRVNGQEIFVPNDSVAKLVVRSINGYTVDSLVARKTKGKGKKVLFDTVKIAVAPISFDSAAARFNTRGTTLETRGVLGMLVVTTNTVTQLAWSREAKDSLIYFANEGGYSFVKAVKKDAAREKTFEEAQSEVSGAFQEFETKRISDAWYASLQKKYPVVLVKDALQKTFVVPQPAAAAEKP